MLSAANSNGDSVVDPLDSLSVLATGRLAQRTVGWRRGKAVADAEFAARVRAWRALLRRTPGQSYALHLRDSIEFGAALLGAWQAQKTIFVPGDCLPGTCAAISKDIDGYLGDFVAAWQPKTPGSEEDGAAYADDLTRFDPNFTGLVLYTSGTTGAAQAIAKKLTQISAELATLEAHFGETIGAADIVATVSPQHIYGLLFSVLWPLSAGRAFHSQSFSFFEQLAPVLSERACILVSSPAHLKRLADGPAWTVASQRLRAVFSSGGPLPIDVVRETNRLLHQVPIEIYGSSETGGIAWRRRHTASQEKWMPLTGVQWRIDEEEGVLEVRSPHLPDEDWFRTADRAIATDDCFLLNGRVDRIAKIEGKRISLCLIESHLCASALVQDARALVIEGRRQRIAVIVVLSSSGRGMLDKGGKPLFNGMMRDLLRPFIEVVGIPRVWRYVDALPINAQGKTTQSALVALLEGEHYRPTRPRDHLVECDGPRAVFELIAPRDLVYFDGHFRNQPILAGVVQVDWVIALGRQCFNLPPLFRGLEALKFHRVISPELSVVLEMVYEADKSRLAFKLHSRLGSHASGRILFGATDV